VAVNDAAHVAAATIARADAIVSWNFRHIVRLDKMKAYNQINLLHGDLHAKRWKEDTEGD
jgi:hypothetical protein